MSDIAHLTRNTCGVLASTCGFLAVKGIFPKGFSIFCCTNSKELWNEHYGGVKEIVPEDACVVSNCQKGLHKLVKMQLLGRDHIPCTKHIEDNFQTSGRATKDDVVILK